MAPPAMKVQRRPQSAPTATWHEQSASLPPALMPDPVLLDISNKLNALRCELQPSKPVTSLQQAVSGKQQVALAHLLMHQVAKHCCTQLCSAALLNRMRTTPKLRVTTCWAVCQRS